MKNEVVWVPYLARPSENFLLNNLYRVQSSVIQAPQSCLAVRISKRKIFFFSLRIRAAMKGEESGETCEGKCVILDVGGDRFVASRRTLERFPSTRYIIS